MAAAKLIVASVRLPVSVSQADGEWQVSDSPGGLATALRALASKRTFTWIGWPGAVVADERPAVEAKLVEHGGVIPVFIGQEEVEGFYEEFANRILWPLFHNLSGPRKFDVRAWEQFQAVNQRFAEVIANHAAPGDTVWIHDYQLILVPAMLRDRGLDCAIGFFLHIPFPSSETYRILPVRESILRGMLGADLIGFHTYEYLSHFRAACLRVLGFESEPESILMTTHNARLGVLPIGIEPDELAEMSASEEAIQQYETLRRAYAGKTVILGVDRLDYTKGLPQKLLAFEEFLHDHPELRDKVVLIQVAAPSRTGVAEYQSLTREINQLAGRINGQYGSLDSQPLVYINQSLPRQRLTALYRLADVALVTPVRDGMNLVSLEYVAVRGENPGVLILSEFAGAASCLAGAILVNPHNPTQIAAALAQALRSGPNPEAFAHMLEFVRTNTSTAWASKFLRRLEEVYAEFRARVWLRIGENPDLVRGAEQPLLLIDYDGTLQPHTIIPEQAQPAPRVREVLRRLSEFGTPYVVSGRPAAVLDKWLGDLPVGLVCEHGLAIKSRGGEWSQRAQLETRILREVVEPVFRDFTERTPGSKIEHKAASIAWHYRGADPKFGAWRAKELRILLEERLRGQPYNVLAGSRVIEVRHANMSKGAAAQLLLRRHPDADFIFCCGDDRTDEEMFEAVLAVARPRTVVCHVGSINTMAPYVVRSTDELLEQLEAMVQIWSRES